MGAVFFSYARADSKIALKLARDLRRAKIDLWIDQLDIAAGAQWIVEDASERSQVGAALFLSAKLSWKFDRVQSRAATVKKAARVGRPSRRA